MAIESVEQDSQQSLPLESKDEQLSRLLQLELKERMFRNQLESKKAAVNEIRNLIKQLHQEKDDLVSKINAGQQTLNVTVEAPKEEEETEEEEDGYPTDEQLNSADNDKQDEEAEGDDDDV